MDKVNLLQQSSHCYCKQWLTVLFISIMLTFTACSTQTQSTLKLETEQGSYALTALNKNARNAETQLKKEGSYLYFSFTQEQKQYLMQKLTKQALSLLVTMQIKQIPENTTGDTVLPQFSLGLLYPYDFSSQGKLKKELDSRSLVQGELSSWEGQTLGAAITLNTAEPAHIPAGFFIYSTVSLKLISASLKPAMLGWETTQTARCFYYGPSGGIIASPNEGFDYSDAKYIFNTQNQTAYHLTFKPAQDIGTPNNHLRIKASIGGEEITVRRTKDTQTAVIPISALENPYAEIHIKENTSLIIAVVLKAGISSEDLHTTETNNILDPIAADPGLILSWNQQHWRTPDYELFAWDRFPFILFFDFRNYEVQDRFLKRLAFFTEKQGFKGKLAQDSEINDLHGYNAHDYRSESLADFYSLAAQSQFPLNSEEQLLCKILVKNNIIQQIQLADGTTVYTPGKGAIVSISRESPDYLRYTFTAHETLHGLYFTDAEFRDIVHQVYISSDPRSIEFLERYFITQPTLLYDINDRYLMENEFMAYMLQRPTSQIEKYFAKNLATWKSVNRDIPELAAYIRNTNAQGFKQAAEQLSQYIFNRWGLSAGRTWLIHK